MARKKTKRDVKRFWAGKFEMGELYPQSADSADNLVQLLVEDGYLDGPGDKIDIFEYIATATMPEPEPLKPIVTKR